MSALYAFFTLIAGVIAILCCVVIFSVILALTEMPAVRRRSYTQEREVEGLRVIAAFAAIGLFLSGGWIFSVWWTS